MAARQVQHHLPVARILDDVAPVQHVVEAATDDDVLVEGIRRHELRVRLNAEGDGAPRLPIRDALEKAHVPFKGGNASRVHTLSIQHRSKRPGKANGVNPRPTQLIP